MEEPGRAGKVSRVPTLLTGRGQWGRLRLGVAIAVAIPCGIWGLIAADLTAWAYTIECTADEYRSGLAAVALVGVMAGAAPALVAGLRRIALLPFAIASAGPAIIFVVFFFTHGQPGECR